MFETAENITLWRLIFCIVSHSYGNMLYQKYYCCFCCFLPWKSMWNCICATPVHIFRYKDGSVTILTYINIENIAMKVTSTTAKNLQTNSNVINVCSSFSVAICIEMSLKTTTNLFKDPIWRRKKKNSEQWHSYICIEIR